MNLPTLALCNYIPETAALGRFASQHGFSGIDWTFKLEDLPKNEIEESRILRNISSLRDFEIRYHCAFNGTDLGDEDDRRADLAMEVFRKAARLISKLEGRFMTVHLGLGRKSPEGLSWEHTLSALSELVDYAEGLGVRLCLENLAAGWSSRPELFEKLIRKTGAGITLDIGHARVCESVQCQIFELEDFVSPYPERVHNAHIYHEETDNRHVPPVCVEDLRNRLDLLLSLSCKWWVLELREEQPLVATLKVVREYLEQRHNDGPASQAVFGD